MYNNFHNNTVTTTKVRLGENIDSNTNTKMHKSFNVKLRYKFDCSEKAEEMHRKYFSVQLCKVNGGKVTAVSPGGCLSPPPPGRTELHFTLVLGFTHKSSHFTRFYRFSGLCWSCSKRSLKTSLTL